MPELPEVETTKASLAPLLDQQVLSVEVRQSSLRWPIPTDLNKLVGQRLIGFGKKEEFKEILAILRRQNPDRIRVLWNLSCTEEKFNEKYIIFKQRSQQNFYH